MTDSINILHTDVVPRIHGSKSAGKLFKGHGIVAANTSIPTKYQTIVIDNGDKRGFGSTAKRFNAGEAQSEFPGPARYLSHGAAQAHRSSDSKRGTGGFASKTKRRVQLAAPSSGVAPTNYDIPSHLQSRDDFRTSTTTSVFTLPLAGRRRQAYDNGLPAPNEYDVARVPRGKTNNVVADAAFKSKSKRELLNVSEARRMPAPGHYDIHEELTKDRVRVPFSSFRSGTDRGARVANKFPGPGEYHPYEPIDPVKRQEMPKKHYLAISAAAMPLPETPPLPGPGQYETTEQLSSVKHYMSSSMFVSSSSRWAGDVQNDASETPGPAHYKPFATGKQSFIYNSTTKWI